VPPSPLPSKRCKRRKAKRHTQGTGLVVETLGLPPEDAPQKQASITGIDGTKLGQHRGAAELESRSQTTPKMSEGELLVKPRSR